MTPTIDDLLSSAAALGASDLHLKAGRPPMVRVEGEILPLGDGDLTESDVEGLLWSILPDRLHTEFKERHEADFAHGREEQGRQAGQRFRINAFRQQGRVSIAARILQSANSDFAALGLPPVIETIIEELRGLVLVTGPTGAGKSTTLAAMIDAINATRAANIITVEDPIEFLHTDKQSMIHQREVGVDTSGFAEAMRRVLRQDPDVILIGEMRDMETIDAALKAAETGHLVLSTLHTLDAAETINRILDFFPPEHQRQVRQLLAGSLRAIISQRLVPTVGGKRLPAVEVLINTERIAERIADADTTHEIPEVMASSGYYGMETFDQSILRLVASGAVTLEVGMRHATNAPDLKLRAQQLGIVPT
jgi:twitching motility protein PilT